MKVLHAASAMRDDWGGIERYVAYLAGETGHGVAADPGSPLAARCAAPAVPARLAHKYDFRAIGAYRRALRGGGYQALVAHYSPDYLVPALAARMAGVPALLTRHVAVPVRAASARAYRRLYAGFVGVSSAVVRRLSEAGLGPAEAAWPGIPDPGARPLPEGPLRVAVVGRLVEEKGQRVAVEAAALGSAEWRIVGEGPDRARLAAMAGPRVSFAGRVEDPAAELAHCHAVAVPSVWEEAFGLVAVEAMALGRAVVASRAGGLAEIVEDGTTGLLVPPGDAAALAQAVASLGPERCSELGAAGRARYEGMFTVRAMAARTTAAYTLLVAR